MVARVSMIIPFNEGFRRIRNNNNNKFSLNRSSTNVQPLSRVINPRDHVTQSSIPQKQKQQQLLLQQQAQEIRREIMRARFTMHNLYGVATAGCRSCGS